MVYTNSGFRNSSAAAAVTNFVVDAGINAFDVLKDPSRVPIHSTATQLWEGKSDAIFAKARDTLPVRVITDRELGALRADNNDTRGVVVITRSVLCVTRDAVRAKATYKPPSNINPIIATIEIVRRGFADWRDRAPKLLFARDTCVYRISIEMSESYCSSVAAGVTEPAGFAHSSNARIVRVGNCEFSCQQNRFSG